MSEKDLPKPQQNEFFYHMNLLFIAWDLRLFKNFPEGLIKRLGSEGTSSLLATLIIEK